MRTPPLRCGGERGMGTRFTPAMCGGQQINTHSSFTLIHNTHKKAKGHTKHKTFTPKLSRREVGPRPESKQENNIQPT